MEIIVQNSLLSDYMIELIMSEKSKIFPDGSEFSAKCQYINSLQTGMIILDEAVKYDDLIDFLLRNYFRYCYRFSYKLRNLSVKLFDKLREYKIRNHPNAIYVAIMNDDLNLIKKFEYHLDMDIPNSEVYRKIDNLRIIMNNVCFHGAMKILGLIFKYYFPSSEQYFCAIEGGKLEIVRYLLECRCNFDNSVIEYASMKGNLEILNLILDKNFQFKNKQEREIFEANLFNTSHLICMKFAKDRGFTCRSKSSFFEAISHDNVECVEFLLDNNFEYHEDLSLLAVQKNSINCLRLFESRNLPISNDSDKIIYNQEKYRDIFDEIKNISDNEIVYLNSGSSNVEYEKWKTEIGRNLFQKCM